MAKENATLSLYRANRERARKAADAALTKAVAAVTKKAAGKAVKPIVEEIRTGTPPPAGGDPEATGEPANGDPSDEGDPAT